MDHLLVLLFEGGLRCEQPFGDMADEFVAIPMYGFVESFNISVSVAVCLSHFCQAIRTSPVGWKLSETEANTIMACWLKASVKHADEIVARYANGETTQS